MTVMDGQMDILAVLAAQEAQERAQEIVAQTGLTSFTVSEEYTPQQLNDAARARYAAGDLPSMQASHMWKYGIGGAGWEGAHPPVSMVADLRTLNWDHKIGGGDDDKWLPGPSEYVERMWCSECERWTSIYPDRAGAAIEYLDHCWPGWKALPPIPFKKAGRMGAPHKSEIPDDYPEKWMVTGAPSINWSNPHFTPPPRPIPSFVQGYSAFGGMGVTIHHTHEYPDLTGVTA